MRNDLICFSHLRWNFVYQRPQHLLTRAARDSRVFYFEEPVYTPYPDTLDVQVDPASQVFVITPQLEQDLQTDGEERTVVFRLKKLVDQLCERFAIEDFVIWYYAPMALEFTNHLKPAAVIYDCMDELSAFKFAPPELTRMEKELISRADIVFTGGHRLYEAKKHLHKNIFPFPSAIDKSFFFPARTRLPQPVDQIQIPGPRLGFFGVIDERFDIDLVRQMANLKKDWQFVFIGPVVKIDPDQLPQQPNIHYLGMKDYKELPLYISGWDICIMPFAINESTEFISPTKTPEFLAAGKPVISTPIHDVVHPYEEAGLVHIAADAETFVKKAEQCLLSPPDSLWLGKVDRFLSTISWNKTWTSMEGKISKILNDRKLETVDIATHL